MKNKLIALLLTTTIAAGTILTGCSGGNKDSKSTGDAKEISITNVSYDPTREFYASYNELFQKHWQKEKGDARMEKLAKQMRDRKECYLYMAGEQKEYCKIYLEEQKERCSNFMEEPKTSAKTLVEQRI